MGNSNSISFNTLMDKINPLNFKDNYNDCVIAFKILLNLSDNDDVRNLGQQIIDSFLLLNLLNSNSKLKKYFLEYNFLCDKLYTFVNKYSQFEKLLRKNVVKTKAYLSLENDKYENDVINSNKVNVIIEDKQTQISYSLNEIIDSTNLFRIILCKDKEEKFKEQISNRIRNGNIANNDVKITDETKELLKRKKANLINTIISDDDISDNQTKLFNLIEEKFKELMYLEQKCYILEEFLDESMSHLFVLDSQIAKLYAEFKELCKNEMEYSIKNRQETILLLNSYLDEYETKYKVEQLNADESNISLSTNISYDEIYDEYISNEKKEYIDFDISDFIEYIKYTFSKKSIDAIDVNDVVDNFKGMYSQYLIKKLGNENDSMNFGEFLKNSISNKDDNLLRKK